MKFQVFTGFTAFFLLSIAAHAETFVPVAAENSGLTFAIAYTAGTHTGTVGEVRGSLEIDPARLEVTAGEIRFPISALDSGNAKRNCHIMESLGLDYVRSVYPEDHACTSANRLPPEGADAVVYPEVRFLYRAAKNGTVTGTFAMHGAERELTVPLKVTAAAGGAVRVQSSFTVRLSDFGVIVKKFVVITVSDEARVSVDLLLQPKKAVNP